MQTDMPDVRPDGPVRRIVNWQVIKVFGQTPVGAATMAAPFIGYLILYHDAIEPYLGGLGGMLDARACGPWIGFETRLHLLYFGLLCLGIGTIIYRVMADPDVKLHGNTSDYVAKNAANVTPRNLRGMLRVVDAARPDLGAWLRADGAWIFEARKKRNHPEVKALIAETGEERKRDVMRSYFNVLDRYSARAFVWAAALFYLTGFALLTVPGLAFTARVLCTIWTGFQSE